jgi:hypothetical protein
MTILLIVTHSLVLAAGAYGWYRYGTSLKATADKVRLDVSDAAKKL